MNIGAKFFSQAHRESADMTANTEFTMKCAEHDNAKITIEIDGAEPITINADGGFAVYGFGDGKYYAISSMDIDLVKNIRAEMDEVQELACPELSYELGGGRL